MLLGLDHAIIAVNNLDDASKRLEHALGLSVAPGGQHPGAGTHNAIVRFGVDYLELISVRDEPEASSGKRGQVLLDFLRRGEGLLGYALGSDDLEADIKAASSRGMYMMGPFPASRVRPDGATMAWSTARLAQDPWGRQLPFVIQHGSSVEERLSWAPVGGHPLGTTGVSLLSLAVDDLESATEGYRRLLGTEPEVVEDVPALPARRSRFRLGNFAIDLLKPTASSGGLAEYVREKGEGVFMITLSVPNLDKAVRFLRERGTAVGDPTPRGRAPLLDPSQTLGSRFQLVQG